MAYPPYPPSGQSYPPPLGLSGQVPYPSHTPGYPQSVSYKYIKTANITIKTNEQNVHSIILYCLYRNHGYPLLMVEY